ncbi:MAG: AraC family transcriptional regulator [Candidatus Marinimicrobia bacterium]|nr:AraC family transcriptional regulator [Candidatus Neomarinimicrobiota bacterium]
MKITEEKIINPAQNSFKVLQYQVAEFNMAFHFHQEYELVYIAKGKGMRYIGNSVEKFEQGDMIFVGPNLGHMWKSENSENSQAEAIVIQFSVNLFQSLIDTPEFRKIKQLLEQANSGIKILGNLRDNILVKMKSLLKYKAAKSVISLLEILDDISESDEILTLNSDKTQIFTYDKRINAVHQFAHAFYHQNISLENAASIANMEKSAFCRFFKDKTQKTFTRFLNELRIDKACDLLQKKEKSVTEVAFECGFNNMANFYRQFKKATGKTPGRFIE